jgi:rhamnosyltransferase
MAEGKTGASPEIMMSDYAPESTAPDVTIAMPTRNAGDQFARTLDAVMSQRTDKRVDYIALDSGSTDDTLVRLGECGVRILTMPQGEFNWGKARNRLFEEARAPIVVHLSQDAVPAGDDWLKNIIRPLDDPAVAVSCGSSIPDPDRAFHQFQWERNGYFYFTREIQKFTARYGKGLSFANTAVRRSAWEAVGIEPVVTGEDFQFQMNLHASDMTIAFPEDAAVLHHHNYALKALYRRCRNEGFALRTMGCHYHEGDLILDLLSARKYIQWLREAKRGALRTPGEALYPVLRPWAVYMGSRFARRYVWY